MNDVDVVIMWVDGGDKSWLREKLKYSEKKSTSQDEDALISRYRDWNNLQYIFRGVEKFMPWVRKVHFVTNGQKPHWLNEHASKLNWVQHKDFMPAEYLPTFSSHAIELNLHRIKNLADKFVLLNDDTFITKNSKREDFFSKQGLPKDQAVLFRITSPNYDDIFPHVLLNDISVINRNFNRNRVLSSNFIKYFSFKNGILSPFLNATFLPTNHFPGFIIHHMPQAYLKETFREVWQKEHDVMHLTSLNKFRTLNDVNQYVMREWQLAMGKFEPTNITKTSKYYSLFPKQLRDASVALRSGKYRMICINDVEVGNFIETRDVINTSLESIMSDKSEFEK